MAKWVGNLLFIEVRYVVNNTSLHHKKKQFQQNLSWEENLVFFIGVDSSQSNCVSIWSLIYLKKFQARTLSIGLKLYGVDHSTLLIEFYNFLYRHFPPWTLDSYYFQERIQAGYLLQPAHYLNYWCNLITDFVTYVLCISLSLSK